MDEGCRAYDEAMLADIVDQVRRRLPDLIPQQEHWQRRAAEQGPARDFAVALSGPGLAVVGEIKRRSPSRGVLSESLVAASRARAYVAGGAAAISVLTEPEFFDGSPNDLREVRAAVPIPVLRKDFTLHPCQVWESRAMGADALLLIVAALENRELEELLAESRRAGIAALVEVHTAEEAKRAVAAGAGVVGVNNRDLTTFEVDLVTAERLASLLDQVPVTVAESGISGPAEAARMARAGYDAVLVGESLVRAADPATAVRNLREGAA